MRHLVVAMVTSMLVPFLLVACGAGSGNGVAAKSPEAIVLAASRALAGVNSVHVSGAIDNRGSLTRVDLYLVHGKGGKGLLAQGAVSFKLVVLRREVYINGSAAFWHQFGASAAAQQLNGKWLKAPAHGQFASLAMLTNPLALFNHLASKHGTLAKGKTTTVRGESVIAVKDTSRGGTLYVATHGRPYPIEIVKSGPGGGRIDFDQFNQPVSLPAPSPAVDVSQLK